MTDDHRYRSAYRDEAPKSDSLLADTIDVAVRRIVTGLVIAGGLIGGGLYLSDGAEPARYQVATTSDGRIVRLNTDSGSLVVCQDNRCWLMQRGSSDLDDEPPAPAPVQQAAPPARLPAPQPEAASAPEAAPQPEPAAR